MHELSGFVNSKIDKFSIINEFDDIILFIENISEAMSLPMQKASIFSSYAKTFISAINNDCQIAIKEKEQKRILQEQYEKEIDIFKEKLKKAENIIESYKQNIEINKAESKKNSLMIELTTIERNFHVMGMGSLMRSDVALSLKQFWFDMVNRYEELLKMLDLEPRDSAMERLLSQLYLSCDNYEKAHEHFLNAIKLSNYITKTNMEFFVESYPFSLLEIIQIYEEKYNNMPEGLTRDFVKGSLNYMKMAEEKKSL